MKVLKVLLVIVFSVLLAVDLVVIMLTATVKTTVLNPEFIKNEIEKQAFITSAKQSLLNQLEKNIEKSKDVSMAELVDYAFPVTWLEAQTGRVVDSLLPYLKSETEKLTLNIPLAEPKTRMKERLAQIIKTSPPAVLIGQPQDRVDTYIKEFVSQLDRFMPDTYNVEERIGEDVKSDLNSIRIIINKFYLGSTLLIVLAFVFAAFVALILRKLKPVFGSVGVSVLVAGALCFISYQVVSSLLNSASMDIQLPVGFKPEMVINVIKDGIHPLNTGGILLLIIGGLLIIASFFLRTKESLPVKNVAG